MERSATQPEPRRVRDGHSFLERCGSLRVHHTTNICGTGLLKQLDGSLDVAVGEFTVAIDADDDLVAGSGNTEIQSGRRTRRRIVDYADSGIRRRQRLGDLTRAVAARAYRNDHFQVTGILLVEHPANGGLEVAFLVQHRHDYRNTRPAGAKAVDQ